MAYDPIRGLHAPSVSLGLTQPIGVNHSDIPERKLTTAASSSDFDLDPQHGSQSRKPISFVLGVRATVNSAIGCSLLQDKE